MKLLSLELLGSLIAGGEHTGANSRIG